MTGIRPNRTPTAPRVASPNHRVLRAIAVLTLVVAAATAGAQEGDRVRTFASEDGFADTTSRLEAAIEEAGLTLVTTIDHAGSAENAGLELPPTTLFVFGNPQAGTPLMQSSRTIALDLPQKILVWEDDTGDVFVSFRDPVALAADHGVAADEGALPSIAELLPRLARTAAGRN